MLIEPCGDAVGDIAPGETAYPHRDQRMVFEWELFHPLVCTRDQETHLEKCLLKARNGLRHMISGGRYVNYADSLDKPSNWWMGNVDRIEAIARHFNPLGTLVTRLNTV
jgi:hypothetical protein